MTLDLDGVLGAWTDTHVQEVRAEHLIAYARAINEPTGYRPEQGDIRLPLYGAVVLGDAVTRAMQRMLPPDLPTGAQPLHGEHDMTTWRPILPGMRLHTRAAPLGMQDKASGSTFLVKSETRDDAGELLNEQYWTAFLPRVRVGRSIGAAAPPRARAASDSEPLARLDERIDDDQTFRYADASGDHTPIHLDPAAARAAGLSGIIVHGLCTLALATRAVVRAAGARPAQVSRVGVRFARPAYPGQRLTTSVWRHDGAYAFETSTDAGEIVLKDGLVAIADR